MIPEAGRRFGPYEIQARLGGGGMGHVFRAWDARLHREVALKLLQDDYTMPGMRERFLREGRAASALNHPNICTIFDIGEQDGDPYLVMELLNGETLKDRIQSQTMQVDEVVSVAREVAEALGAAHAKGVIHRDIKPANIFLVDRPNGTVQAKVLDFGLAKIQGGVLGARQSRSLDLTTAGATVGTLAYMSPEQARGEDLDSRSDLFSLGVVMYEMATKRIPFPGATSALVFVKLLNQAPEPVREWNEAIPRELEKVIFKLMAKERTARFQTSRELEEALDKISGRSQGGAGWLRKAVSTVPLVRPQEPVARDRRPVKRPRLEVENDSQRSPWTDEPHSAPHGNEAGGDAAPRIEESAQMLRPVARVPRSDLTPRAALDSTRGTTDAAAAARSEPTTQTPHDAALEKGSPASSMSPAPAPDAPSRTTAIKIDPRKLQSDPTMAPSAGAASSAESHVFQRRSAARSVEALSASLPAKDQDIFSGSIDGAADQPPPRARINSTPTLIGVGLVALIVVGILAAFVINRGRFGRAMLTERDAAVVTEIENRTGDRMLDGVVAKGLEIVLAESPYLRLDSGETYRTARRLILASSTSSAPGVTPMLARPAAQRLGAKAYFVGFISGATPPYLLHVELRNTATDDVMSSAEQHVDGLQQLPAAIDRLAGDLRSNAGEDSDSIARTSNPLSREGTADIEALNSFARGADALAQGKTIDAMHAYQHAVAIDPKFVQAQLGLVVIYRKLRAEVAAAETAKVALAAADQASDKLRSLAQYEYEVNASGDYPRATAIIRQLVAIYPHDAQTLERLARVLRLQGRMAEALQTAQQAYAEDPLNTDAYTQAENALIGLDRYDAAFQLEGQLQRLGVAHVGGMLTSAYLEGRQEAIEAAVTSLEQEHTGFRSDWNYGIYLDNIGHLSAGTNVWRSNADASRQEAGLESAGAFLLSQGSLDRALLGECGPAMLMARDSDRLAQGPTALFNAGMAHALCGDEGKAQQVVDQLGRAYPQSFPVHAFYLADIQASIALSRQNPAAALESLKQARQWDLISLTPYLRGRAHVAMKQGQIGIVDFQTILAHRGVTFITGSDVSPAAQIGVARAFAETGDANNSAQAYRRFLELWSGADQNQPLLAEARAHTR